jgi:exodeoxyribonuclease-5
VKFPNKVRNTLLALLTDAGERLNCPPRSFVKLAKWAKTQKGGKDTFTAWCLALESGKHTANDLPFDDPVAPILSPSPDARFGLIFDMIDMFYLADVNEFWQRPPTLEEALTEPAPEPEQTSINPNALTPEESAEIFGCPPAKQIVRYGERPTIKWNKDQGKAIKAVLDWYKEKPKHKQIYRLFGWAGSGKTSIIQEIACAIRDGDGVPKGEVLFAAFTGKAAAVMMGKGCSPAQTIHSLIYKPMVDPLTGKVIGFKRNDESPLRYASLLICDEVSMVNEEMANDLLSFGVHILVVGDPGQIEPIRGEGFFILAEPDSLLTRIERVAEENPLIWLATRVREGKPLKPGTYGTTHIYRGKSIPDELIVEADQLLCGMNKTRQTLNRRYRVLRGFHERDSEFPVRGDRLMGLKNNKDTGVLNGTQWHCDDPVIKRISRLKDFRNPGLGSEETNIDGLYFRARSCDLFDANGDPLIINTVCSAHHFDPNLPQPQWRDIAGTDEYTFAYASTVHKFQGSQAPYIVIADESFVFRDQEWKHRYTALTRASERADIFM